MGAFAPTRVHTSAVTTSSPYVLTRYHLHEPKKCMNTLNSSEDSSHKKTQLSLSCTKCDYKGNDADRRLCKYKRSR
jgi:hypothetical protein